MEQVHGTATVTITLAWAAVLPAESLKGSTKAEVLQDNHENVMRSKALNSCIQQSFFNKRVMQTSTEVVFGKDMSRWLLPKSSKCACNCVRAIPEQPLRYWRSNRRRCHHIQEAPPSDHPRAKWVTACEPTNQRINFSLLRCIKKVVASHTLHLPFPIPHFSILGEGVFERHRSPFPRHQNLIAENLHPKISTQKKNTGPGDFNRPPRALAKGPKGQRLPPKKWRGKG